MNIEQIEFSENTAIPVLGWIAIVERNNPTVVVEHGSKLAVRENWFIGGTWNGDFQTGDFANATFMAGTGGYIFEGKLAISLSTNNSDPVYIFSGLNRLYLSNSLTYLMTVAGLRPHPHLSRYDVLFMKFDAGGVYRKDRALPMERGAVYSYEALELHISPDLSFDVYDKPQQPLPGDFDQFVALLEETARAVVANAADENRPHRYPSMVQASRGYDSLALALATLLKDCGVGLGCGLHSPRDDEYKYIDDGTEAMRSIGYEAHSIVKNHPLGAAPGEVPEAPFCMVPPALDMPVYNMRPLLENRIRFIGDGGDICFGIGDYYDYNDLTNIMVIGGTGTIGSYEYRLDINCISVPLFAFGWRYRDTLRALSVSDSMKPWRVEHDYDRPIPRRIITEGGMDPQFIADRKQFTKFQWTHGPEKLSPDTGEAYLDFVTPRLSRRNLQNPKNFLRKLPFLLHFGFHHYKNRFEDSRLIR